MSGAPAPQFTRPGLVQAALSGLCPRCGAKTLFAGKADFAPSCSNCGLDFSQYNVGDGPAAFLTMLVGTVVLGLVLWTHFTFHPPLWVHAVIWIPLTFVLVLWSLRVAKAALIYAEHTREARQATSADLNRDGQ